MADLIARMREAYLSLQAGRANDAAAIFREVADVAPPDIAADALVELGVLASQGGRWGEAEAALRRAAALQPTIGSHLARLGVALRGLGRAAEAVEAYDAAIALGAADAATHSNRANALLDLDRNLEALAASDAALALAPDSAVALRNRGVALTRLQRPDPALAALDASLRLEPGHAQGHFLRGNALMLLERFAEALTDYDAAIRLEPGYAPAHHGRGRALIELDFQTTTTPTHAEALASFDRALALAPDFHEVRWARAMALLRLGRFREGWIDHEHRWQVPAFFARCRATMTPALLARVRPDTAVADVAGRAVLLVAEQGIGDEVMFASALPDLLAVARSVSLVCEARMHGLLAASFPMVRLVLPEDADAAARDADVVLGAASLGALFRPNAGAFPGTPYLRVGEAVRRRWAERLGPKRAVMRIGVSWRGGLAITGTSRRSMPLAALRPVLDLPDAEIVNLQYGDVAAEVAAENARRAAPIWSPAPEETWDAEALAGLIEAMDVVVSVQTAVVHFAGALGKPALAMIPRLPEWRYGVGGARMPWYGSVELIRQGLDEDWAPVVETVAETLVGLRGDQVRA